LAADRLRRLVNERPFDLGKNGQKLKVTASVGVATSGRRDIEKRHLNKICDQADAALYVAKSAGRNQVAMSKSAA
jgi:two-component system cell cycle response regulator